VGSFSFWVKSNGVFTKDLLLIVKAFFPQRDNLTALAEGGPNALQATSLILGLGNHADANSLNLPQPYRRGLIVKTRHADVN